MSYRSINIMARKKIITTKEFDNNQLTEKEHFFYKNYLDRGIEMIDSASKKHSKVMQTRIDFHYPQDMRSDGTNKDFSNALYGLVKELRREGYDPQYLGRREQKNQANPHYHLNILTNARDFESGYKIFEKAEHHWGHSLGMTQQEVHSKGLVHYCDEGIDGERRVNGNILARGREDYQQKKDQMIQQMSYLTKYDPNDTTPSSTRKLFASQNKEKKATVPKASSRKSK